MVGRILAVMAGVIVGASVAGAQTTRPAVSAVVAADPVSFETDVDADIAAPPKALAIPIAPTIDPTVGRYTGNGVDVDVPSDWSAYAAPGKNEVRFVAPRQGSKGPQFFFVRCTDLGENGAPNLDDPAGFNSYKDTVMARFADVNPGWSALTIERAVVDDLPGLRVVGTALDGKTAVKVMQVRVVRDRTMYVFGFVATPERFDEFFNTAKHMVRTVKFEKQAPVISAGAGQ